MAYVTPGTVAAGDVATAAAWNVITNDVIFLSKPPMCIARRNAAQAIPDNANTLISFDTEVVDTDGMFAPTSTNITIQTAGVYLLTAYVVYDANITTTLYQRILLNGTAVASSQTPGNNTEGQTLSVTKSLSATNVITFQVYQSGPGTTKNTTSVTQLAATWLGFAS